MTVLICPRCHHSLKWQQESILCSDCHNTYDIKDGIPVFTSDNNYWCNIDRKTMRELISDTEASGDWESAAKKHVPQYIRHFAPLYRGDAQFMFPVTSSARVLDAGSMWGGVTVPLARFCKEVYAVDKTWETLRFLQARASQLQLDNIIPVASPIHSLPFPDEYFDFVVLNGVLEWLGTEEEIVLDQTCDGRPREAHKYESNPREVQLAGLNELYRVIKPGGGIYVAIENRIGLPYFLGHPDDHAMVRFVSLLPRKMANVITTIVHNSPYRTYMYSPRKLVEFIEEAGFNRAKLFAAYPHYNTLARMTPFTLFNKLGSIPLEGDVPYRASLRTKVFMFSKAWKLIPKWGRKYLSPSLSVIASKGPNASGVPRLLKMLTQVGILGINEAKHHEVILMNNRFDNCNPVNYLVYDTAKAAPRFFCKIDRGEGHKSLAEEAELIAYAAERLQGTPLAETIPSLYFAGTVDQVLFQVTGYISGKRVDYHTLNALRRVNQFISSEGKLRSWAIDQIKKVTRRIWLALVRKRLIQAIDWLVLFQETTLVRRFDIGVESTEWIDKKVGQIAANGMDVSAIERPLQTVVGILEGFSGVKVPICMQHGDFDICNLLATSTGLAVIDFEHAEKEALPFFDLANLILAPLLQEWKSYRGVYGLAEYAESTEWKDVLENCLRHYAKNTGIPCELLRLLPTLSAIEQNAKQYPEHRDPNTYPMFGQESLEAMVGWTMEIK